MCLLAFPSQKKCIGQKRCGHEGMGDKANKIRRSKKARSKASSKRCKLKKIRIRKKKPMAPGGARSLQRVRLTKKTVLLAVTSKQAMVGMTKMISRIQACPPLTTKCLCSMRP